jgi:trehalose 6-phosphate phosphatase
LSATVEVTYLKYLFSRSNSDLLEMFASSNVLLAFDYDGTLAPLVPEPERAAMRFSTRRLLKRASALYPCVVISGRAQTDALARLHGIDIGSVVGNHGAEPSQDEESIRRTVERWLPAIKRHLSGWPGTVIEDKGLSVAVHYRHARQRHLARRAIVEAARGLKDVRLTGGKLVVNLVVRDAPHKGLALEQAQVVYACDTAIYVGDDETDEDIFRLRRPACLTIRVGQKRTSHAKYYLRGQSEIDKLLETLVILRRALTKDAAV